MPTLRSFARADSGNGNAPSAMALGEIKSTANQIALAGTLALGKEVFPEIWVPMKAIATMLFVVSRIVSNQGSPQQVKTLSQKLSRNISWPTAITAIAGMAGKKFAKPLCRMGRFYSRSLRVIAGYIAALGVEKVRGKSESRWQRCHERGAKFVKRTADELSGFYAKVGKLLVFSPPALSMLSC